MSELLIEHPVVLIENLLKLRVGDKGRLLYLRKAIQTGKKIYDSDKNYLKKMATTREEFKNFEMEGNANSTSSYNPNKNTKFISVPSIVDKKFSQESSDKTKKTHDNKIAISKIQNLILDLKKKNSKLMDNLELFLLSREISAQPKRPAPVPSNSLSKLINTKNSDLFDLLKNDSIPINSKPKSFKNYNVYAKLKRVVCNMVFRGSKFKKH